MTIPTHPAGTPHQHFVTYCVAAAAVWLLAALLVIQVIDPYGVSPIGSRIAGFNAMKPERVDIDRLIKPYEVWTRQPATLFMGTSRIHQSIDPQVLDGTALAPAYNASVPANSLGMNIPQLEQYSEIDPALEQVFAELFIYNFMGQDQTRQPQNIWQSVRRAAPLFFSLSALHDSAKTLIHNVMGGPQKYEISEGGNFVYPPGHDAAGTFAGFAAGIWAMHPKNDEGPQLGEASFEALDDLIALAHEKDIGITFIATPNHAYWDAYFEYIGGWDRVAEWLKRASAKGRVFSFSQPNGFVYEEVGHSMVYWNDPFHFSLEMGRHMQHALAGDPLPDTPPDFMVELTPGTIDEHIAQRRAGIKVWMQDHPEYMDLLISEHQKWLASWQPGTSAPAP